MRWGRSHQGGLVGRCDTDVFGGLINRPGCRDWRRLFFLRPYSLSRFLSVGCRSTSCATMSAAVFSRLAYRVWDSLDDIRQTSLAKRCSLQTRNRSPLVELFCWSRSAKVPRFLVKGSRRVFSSWRCLGASSFSRWNGLRFRQCGRSRSWVVIRSVWKWPGVKWIRPTSVRSCR